MRSSLALTTLRKDIRAQCADMPMLDAVEVIRSIVGKNVIVSYDTNANATIILSHARNNANDALASACSGVVIDATTWCYVSIPAPVIHANFKMRDLHANIMLYSMYAANDGTIVTLYWRKQWLMSSASGIDVSSYTWMCSQTYMELFIEVTQAYPAFSFDKLDKNMSYTIVFRHHKLHPMLSNPAGAWLVQATQLDTAMPVLVDIGLPQQVIPALGGDCAGDLVGYMRTLCANAYDTYVRDGTHNFGYIFRSNTCPDLYLESSLMKKIRQCMYDMPKTLDLGLIRANDRAKFMALRACLSTHTRVYFAKLFPQYVDDMRGIDEALTALTARVCVLLNQSRIERQQTKRPATQRSESLAQSLTSHIELTSQVNANEPNGIEVVRDFIYNRDYTLVYYSALFA